jgi:hypothetical protein
MRIDKRNRSTRIKLAPASFCPQIPHDLTRARTRTAAIGSRRLTAWAMARPIQMLQKLCTSFSLIKPSSCSLNFTVVRVLCDLCKGWNLPMWNFANYTSLDYDIVRTLLLFHSVRLLYPKVPCGKTRCSEATFTCLAKRVWIHAYPYTAANIVNPTFILLPTESTWYCGHYWPIVPVPDDRWWWLWRNWWNEDWQGKSKYSEKTCSSATLSTTNPTWPDLG